MISVLVHVLVFGLGLGLVGWTLLSAVYTVVLPRGVNSSVTRFVIKGLGFGFFFPLAYRIRRFRARDQLLALFAPVSLLLLPIIWLTLIWAGFVLMFWSLEVQPWSEAITLSGSSLLTLGFAVPKNLGTTLLAFLEAIIGIAVLSLQITYLPSIYSAFSRREIAITRLARRAGTPPSALKMFEYFQHNEDLDELEEVWKEWEIWFAELEESHTSFPFLVFFRSPTHTRNWITAAGTVLDCAALTVSTLAPDEAFTPKARLILRAGSVALQDIAAVLDLNFDNPNPPVDPAQIISVTRAEYDKAYDQLASLKLALKPDREQSWQDFVRWRLRYDRVLVGLADRLQAPYALWSSDRKLT